MNVHTLHVFLIIIVISNLCKAVHYADIRLCKHLGIDSSTDHPDRYSNLFLNAYINPDRYSNLFLNAYINPDRYSNLFLNAYINRHVNAGYLK